MGRRAAGTPPVPRPRGGPADRPPLGDQAAAPSSRVNSSSPTVSTWAPRPTTTSRSRGDRHPCTSLNGASPLLATPKPGDDPGRCSDVSASPLPATGGRSRRWAAALAGAAAITVLAVSGCGSSVSPRVPTSLEFSPTAPPAANANCQQTAPGGGAQVTGGPPVSYVAVSSSYGQLFAWCNLLAFRPSPSGPWEMRHLGYDLTAAALLSGGRVFGLGYQFAAGGLRFLSIQGSVSTGASWTATPISGVHPATYDSLSCAPSGALCVASPGALTVWAQLCPQAGMGQPPPPTTLTSLPLFAYRPGAGWSELGSLPAGGVFPTATVTGAGNLLVGGSEGGKGVIEMSQDGGQGFHLVATSPAPVAAIASAGLEGVAVGGTPGCSIRPAPAGSGQEVLETSDGGRTWQAELLHGHGGLPLTAVALSGSGLAEVGAGVDPECGSLAMSGCYPTLLTIAPPGGLTAPTNLALQPSVFAAGPGSNLLAVTAQGLLLTSADGGKSWQLQGRVTPPQLSSVHFFAGHSRIGVAQVRVGATQVSLQTTDGGAAWEAGPELPPSTPSALAWASLQVGYAVEGSGTLLKTTDGGRAWHRLPWTGQGLQVVSLEFQDAARGWAEVDAGRGAVEVLQTGDGGRQWTPLRLADLAPPLTPSDFAATETGGRTVVATLYGWGWRTWTGNSAPRSVAVGGPLLPQAVTVSTGGSVWALGTRGWWYRPVLTVWVGGPGTWAREVRSLPTSSVLSAVGFTSAGDGWMVIAGALFRTVDGGSRWLELPLRFSAVDGVSLP